MERVNFPQIPQSTDFFPSTVVSTPGGPVCFGANSTFFLPVEQTGLPGLATGWVTPVPGLFPTGNRWSLVSRGQSSTCSRAWPGPPFPVHSLSPSFFLPLLSLLIPSHPPSFTRSVLPFYLPFFSLVLSVFQSRSITLSQTGALYFLLFHPSPNFDFPAVSGPNPRLCLQVRNHHPVFSAHKTLLEFICPPLPSRLSRFLVSLLDLVVCRLALSYRIGPHATGATILTALELDLTLTSAPSSHSRPTTSEYCGSQSNWTSSQCLTTSKHPIYCYTSASPLRSVVFPAVE